MMFWRQILKNLLYRKQELKHNVYLSWYSDVRLYSVCSATSHCVDERQNSCENSLSIEHNSIYYIEDGLRKVYPFYYNYSTFCKGRWIKKNIVDVYHNEYALYPREEIVHRISNGFVKVNDQIVNVNYVLKSGDLISSTIHRHELAVLACPVEILFENDDLLVVNKPPSIPVHPCGLYYYNTIVSILANEYNKHDLHVVYRLDRLTSGVLLLAKSNEKASEIHGEMDKRNIKKEYVCRVEGNFPEGNIICNKPIKQFYHRVGACLVDSEGKTAMTEFKKLSYNGKSSVVLCKPHTGRTHQIRVHLQYLGHPIINDPIYNSSVFGPLKGKGGVIGKSVSQLLYDLFKEQSSEWKQALNGRKSNFLKFSIFKNYYHMNKELLSYKKDCSKILKDENCYFCKSAIQDPEQNSLGIFLHACKYETDYWKFESAMPVWASEDWNTA